MEEVTAGVYLVSINRSRYSAVYGWGPCENGFPSRGHQRGSASAAAQAWLEKEIYSSNPSKTNIRKYGPSKNKLNRLSQVISVAVAVAWLEKAAAALLLAYTHRWTEQSKSCHC